MLAVRVFIALAIAQAVLVAGGAIASLIEIEWIIGIGPSLSLLGAVLTICAARRGLPIGVVYGMGVPGLSILCFLLINVFEWSPAEAYCPINAIIAHFAMANAPLC